MKRHLLPILIAAVILLSSCAGLKQKIRDAATYEGNPSDTEPKITNPSGIKETVSPAPDINENYIPVHNGDVTEPPHVNYPDWNKIYQPYIKEFDEAESSFGQISDDNEPVNKLINVTVDGTYEEYYNSQDRVILTYFDGNGDKSPDKMVRYRYYTTGELFREDCFDMTKEGKPDYLYIWRKDGSRFLYGSYDEEGHLDLILRYDENGELYYSNRYYQTTELRETYSYLNGMLATVTAYFTNGDVSKYCEYDDAGLTHYSWEKQLFGDGGYMITEIQGGKMLQESFTSDGTMYDYYRYSIEDSSSTLIERISYPNYLSDDYSYKETTFFDGTNYCIEYYESNRLTARYIRKNTNGWPGEIISSEFF